VTTNAESLPIPFLLIAVLIVVFVPKRGARELDLRVRRLPRLIACNNAKRLCKRALATKRIHVSLPRYGLLRGAFIGRAFSRDPCSQ